MVSRCREDVAERPKTGSGNFLYAATACRAHHPLRPFRHGTGMQDHTLDRLLKRDWR
jgi:hypothetical protein